MDQLLLSREETAKALSISVDTLDRLAASGKIHRLKIGAKTCYHIDAVKAFAANLSAAGAVHLVRR